MKHLSLIILFIISCNITKAQIDREFWFAIPKETYYHGSLSATNNASFKITAMSLDATVTIEMPANLGFTPITVIVPAGQSRIVNLANNYNPDFASIYNNTATYSQESKTGMTNRGILITATNDITVYYDYDVTVNRELFSLKGKNALGSEFFTPFQNIWTNNSSYARAFSSIEIVATEDDTWIDIYPTQSILLENGNSSSSPISIHLNRGEAYSVRAKSQSAAGHLAGTRVVARDNKKIAVSTNDDSVDVKEYDASGNSVRTCQDIIGDQLIPTHIIGSKYLIMIGDRTTKFTGTLPKDPRRGEQIFIVTTKPNTEITFYDKNGNVFYSQTYVSASTSDYISPDISKPELSSIYIKSNDKPFYVFHITGIGGELGAAIVPPLNDCTGSSEVNFYRSNTTNDFIVNLMIPYNNSKSFDDAAQAHNFFQLITYNTDGTVASSVPISGNAFEADVASGWAVLKMTERDFAARTTAGKTHSITNTKDFFHFGMQNNTNGQTGKYAYFSSFNVAQPNVRVSQTGEPDIISCFGEPVTFVASGGLSYTWHYGAPSGPPTYLSDPHSATPQVINVPAGSHNFYVEITNPKCFSTEILMVRYKVLPIVKADFELDKSTTCALDSIVITNKSIEADIYTWKVQKGSDPEEIVVPANNSRFKVPAKNLTADPIVYTFKLLASSSEGCADQITKTITVYPGIQANFETDKATVCSPDSIVFTNKTTNATSYTWQKQIGSGPAFALSFTPPHSAMKFTEYYNNPSSTASLNIKYNLIVENSYGCKDTASKNIVVYPKVTANFSPNTSEGCSPLNVSITNNSSGSGLSSIWACGDGNTFNTSNLSHTFINNGNVTIIYAVRLIVWSQSMCADTATQNITVYPKVDANFTSSIAEGCSPLSIFFQNLSSQNVSYKWNFGDNWTSQEIDPLHIFLNNNAKDSSYTVTLTSMSIYGCADSVKKAILVYPKLIADFSASDTVGYSPLSIQFTNNTSDNNATYYWIFGDGDNSSAISPSHEFQNNSSAPLKYKVSLYATNEINCKDTASRTIRVKPRASAIHPQISEDEGISLYPIPARKEVTIEYSLENPANVIIELFSTDGKLISSKNEYKLSGKNRDILELDGINGKAFLVKLRHSDKIQTIKGIKE